MGRIVATAEDAVRQRRTTDGTQLREDEDASISDAVAAAACELGRRIGAVALCCFTRSGDTAIRLAKQRSPLPLIAFAHNESVRARLAFSWGIESAVLAPSNTAESMPAEVSRGLAALGISHPGSLVVVVSGSRSNVSGYTDRMRVLRIE